MADTGERKKKFRSPREDVAGATLAARVTKLLSYEPDTGALRWKIRRGPMVPGSVAGSFDNFGYVRVNVGGTLHAAHRLAWFLYHGKFPDLQIDHINGIRHDNRIANLRTSTQAQNMANTHPSSASGVKGVHQRSDGTFQASIRVAGRQRHLGTFAAAEDAARAYAAAAKESFGEFASAPDRAPFVRLDDKMGEAVWRAIVGFTDDTVPWLSLDAADREGWATVGAAVWRQMAKLSLAVVDDGAALPTVGLRIGRVEE